MEDNAVNANPAQENGAERTEGKVSGKNVFKIAGAIIGFMIGAGFATGQ